MSPHHLLLRFPDGSTTPLSAAATHGRGSHASLVDAFLSRQHIALTPVDGLPAGEELVMLKNLGRNPLVVELLQPDDRTWQAQPDTLQQGQETYLGPGSRFYVAARAETTCFTLTSSSSSSETAAAAASPAGSDAAAAVGVAAASMPIQRLPAAGAAAMGAGSSGNGVSAAAGASGGGLSHLESDAAMAAALAAAEAGGSSAQHVDSDFAFAQLLQAQEASRAAAAAAAAGGGADGSVDGEQGLPPAKRHKAAGPNSSNAAAAAAAAAAAGGGGDGGDVPTPPALGEAPYSLFAVNHVEHPTVDPAWAQGCLGARLSDLVAGDIQLALVGNYMYEWSYFPQHCCPGLLAAKQVILVEGEARRQKGPEGGNWYQRAHTKAAAAERAFKAAAAATGQAMPELACHSPEVEAWGTHHSKVFVLGYPDGGVRVTVHTANLLFRDCESKTQGLWWQDFPPKQQQPQQQQQQQQQQQHVCEFERTLSAYVHSLQLPGPWGRRVAALIAGADFSAARGVLIGSVPGRHSGPSLQLWGHMGLRHALSQQQLPARFRAADTVLQCSSLGRIGPNKPEAGKPSKQAAKKGNTWLEELQDSLNAGQYVAEQQDGTPAAAAAAGAAAGSSNSSQQQQLQRWPQQLQPQQQQRRRPRLHFVWPTAEDVRQSVEGWAAGGSIPAFHDKLQAECLQHLFRRWGGAAVGRQEAMPHIKTFTRFLPTTATAATTPQPEQQQGQPQQGQPQQGQQQPAAAGYELPWFLVTSHNLSKAAWGELQKGGQQLFIRSYELGVLCLPSLEAAYRRHPHRSYCCTPQRPGVVPGTCPGTVRFWAWNQPRQGGSSTPAAAAAAAGAATQVGSSSGSSGGEALAVYVPVPYDLPPPPYDVGSDRPWCLDVAFPGRDRFGLASTDR